MRMPASGVFIWCAASAMKRFCMSMVCDRRPSISLSERTSGEISSGTWRESIGDRSSGRRARMRSCSCASGDSPRASANHTSASTIGKMMNCGRITPLMISLASCARLSSVSATCTSAARGSSPRAAVIGGERAASGRRFTYE